MFHVFKGKIIFRDRGDSSYSHIVLIDVKRNMTFILLYAQEVLSNFYCILARENGKFLGHTVCGGLERDVTRVE